jgi:hypothetical protein
MPISIFADNYGIFEPEDLTFLKSVFADACAIRGDADPDDIARKLLVLFKGGTRATGITEAQARELVALLGFPWSSLMREAHLPMRKR